MKLKDCFLLFFVILLLIRPFSDGLTYPDAQNLFQLAVFGAAIIYLALVLTGYAIYRPSGLELPAGVFLLVTLAAAAGSASPYRSEVVFLQYVYCFSLFFLLFQTLHAPPLVILPNGEKVGERRKRKKDLDSRLLILTVILLTGVLVSFYGIQQHFWGLKDTLAYLVQKNMADKIPPDMLARLYSNRVFSTFVYPNIFAAFLIALIPITFALAVSSANTKMVPGKPAGIPRKEIPAGKFFGTVLFLIFGVTLMFTKSSGAIMVLFLVFLLWLAGCWARRIKNALPFFVLTGGFLLLFLVLHSFKLIPHILSLQDRFFYWISSLEIFRQHPLLGFGPGSFGVQYARFKLPAAMETQHAHSIFFEILSESGLLGAAAFFWFWVLLLRKSWKAADTGLQKGIFWGVMALFLHSQVDFNLADPSLSTYLFVLPALIALKTGPEIHKNDGKNPQRRLTQTVAGLIILLLLFSFFRLAQNQRAEKIYRNGLDAISAGDGSRGLALLEKAIEIKPDNAAYSAQLGALFQKAGEAGKNPVYFQKSAYAYQKACKAEPYSASFRFRLGLAAESAAELTGDRRWAALAKESFKVAVTLYPTKEEYRRKLK